MTRLRRVLALALVLGAAATALGACGGSDDEGTTTNPAPATAPGGAAPTPGALPPEFVECMADQGYDVETQDDFHSAPQDVLQACFGQLH